MTGYPISPLSTLQSFESWRRRMEWNNRFEHWERPASVTEEGTISRAQTNVAAAIKNNAWLSEQGVKIYPQGSYHNNTNVRTEADIDLRLVHPSLKVEYSNDVVVEYADSVLSIVDYGMTFSQIFSRVRAELISDFSKKFGALNVKPGNKAIRIAGITGSRAEVDVVPSVIYRYIHWYHEERKYVTLEGVAILGCDGSWTLNYPDRHSANGIAKRARTAFRFKKIVRVFKRLRADMQDRGILKTKVPSFLVECLVYLVEDAYFLVEDDDRYGRVRRIAWRMHELISDKQLYYSHYEINDIKMLFGASQAWTYDDALTFVQAVIQHLGNE